MRQSNSIRPLAEQFFKKNCKLARKTKNVKMNDFKNVGKFSIFLIFFEVLNPKMTLKNLKT